MMKDENEGTKHDLVSGARFVLTDESSFLRITSGICEVYARDKQKCQQMFLMEMEAGTTIFPSMDEFGNINIFIYALTDVTVEICSFDANISVEALRKVMKEWFDHLIQVPFLQLFADRGDDMLMLWQKDDFLLDISDKTALLNTFVEHEQTFSMLLGIRFIADDKKNCQRMEMRESYKKRLLGTSVNHLLRDEAGLEGNEIIEDQVNGEAVYIVRQIAVSLSMPIHDIKIAPELAKKLDQLTLIRRLMQKANMQTRLIALEKEWYKSDCGTILGYWGEKKELVALVPTSPSTYKIVTKQCPEGQLLTAELAKYLDKDAFVCYAGFPARRLTVKDLLIFMFKQCWRQDYQVILMTSIVAGLIPILTPVITETIFSDIIPTLDRQSLATVTQVMMVTGFTTAAITIVRSIAVMRITNHLDMATEAALWSRLLALPAKFFRRFQTGELLNRMHGIVAVKSLVTGEFVGGIFNFVFSFWSLLLMGYYSIKLTAAALAVWVVYFVIVAIIYWRVIGFQRKKIDADNKTAGQVQQIFVSLPKFRVQGAEEQAFYLWSKVFGEEWKWNLKLRWQNNYNAIIGSVQPFILTMLLYYMVMDMMKETNAAGEVVSKMSYAKFLAFQAAFSSFNATMISVIPLVAQAFGVKPHIDNLRPILEEEPEVTEDKIDSDILVGGLEVSHLTFAYRDDTPEVLKEISFKIGVGEKIAIVGRSGCGKSTLMRLLLGLEQPKSGAIYYDGQDLAELNFSSVRSQLGVVLQNGQLMTGDIFTNIVGTTTLTMDDAWAAAENVGIADDIRAMPMGMYTMISEGSGNISGGQRQRLLIARAIVNRPAVIILDEATSALDNRTQAIVTDSLKKMNCTQIIVAHRLTTIRDADKILVMDKGRVVETGSYDDLVARGGIFANLASRQLV